MSGFSPLQPVARHILDGIDLAKPEEWQEKIPWEPFYKNVEIYRLYGDGQTGAAAALLRFQPGGKIPRHTHQGYEHILVLSGSQLDDEGQFSTGALRIHPPGSTHSVVSPHGCIVLAIYEKPVSFVTPQMAVP